MKYLSIRMLDEQPPKTPDVEWSFTVAITDDMAADRPAMKLYLTEYFGKFAGERYQPRDTDGRN